MTSSFPKSHCHILITRWRKRPFQQLSLFPKGLASPLVVSKLHRREIGVRFCVNHQVLPASGGPELCYLAAGEKLGTAAFQLWFLPPSPVPKRNTPTRLVHGQGLHPSLSSSLNAGSGHGPPGHSCAIVVSSLNSSSCLSRLPAQSWDKGLCAVTWNEILL